MCQIILRVTYSTNEVQDIQVDEQLVSVDSRIDDLQAKETVQRIEVFTRLRDLRKTTSWIQT